MSAIDRAIDELYGLPLQAFTAARNALAKSLKGDEAARVKRLEKPAAAPWAVNQLYWRERRTYDRLMAAGRALRVAQIDALEGTSTDLRASTADHRAALAAALSAATQLAAHAGTSPQPDPLARMLEALSLAEGATAPPGRLVAVIEPAGFEALTGVAPAARLQAVLSSRGGPGLETRRYARPATDEAAGRQQAQEAAAARKDAEASVAAATRRLEQATFAETRAQALVEASKQQMVRAESSLGSAHAQLARARAAHTDAEAALDALVRQGRSE